MTQRHRYHSLFLGAAIGALLLAGCAGNSPQDDDGPETRTVCDQRQHSGSRLGIRNCREVPVEDEGGA